MRPHLTRTMALRLRHRNDLILAIIVILGVMLIQSQRILALQIIVILFFFFLFPIIIIYLFCPIIVIPHAFKQLKFRCKSLHFGLIFNETIRLFTFQLWSFDFQKVDLHDIVTILLDTDYEDYYTYII